MNIVSTESFYRKMRTLGINQLGQADHLFSARIPDSLIDEAYPWCQSNFGDSWIWRSPTQTDYTDLYFKTPEDALLFRLRFETLVTA